MSEFIFDLSSLNGVSGSVASFESGLMSKTPDDKLTYSGNDPIIWDRTNNERLRRGLSPLPGTRPVDDGKTYGGRQGNPPASTAPNRPLTEEEKPEPQPSLSSLDCQTLPQWQKLSKSMVHQA